MTGKPPLGEFGLIRWVRERTVTSESTCTAALTMAPSEPGSAFRCECELFVIFGLFFHVRVARRNKPAHRALRR